MDWTQLFPVAMGFASRYIFAGAKIAFPWLDRRAAPIQQIGVLGLAAAVSWGSQYAPGLDQIVAAADPGAAAALAAVTAFAIHRPSSSSSP